MSAPGCCRHCTAECETTDEQHVLEFDGSWILLRTCPACAEAERIADWIDTHDVAVVNLPADAAVAVMQSILAARIRDGVG